MVARKIISFSLANFDDIAGIHNCDVYPFAAAFLYKEFALAGEVRYLYLRRASELYMSSEIRHQQGPGRGGSRD
jgi:hypothetical protein